MNTPVLLIFFNRKYVLRIINILRKRKVRNLYLASDGGRTEEEKEKIEHLRESVKKAIDWECDVHYRFSDTNQGCEWGPVNAINWVFEKEEECIILEDDCVPEETFFDYCTELLGRYKCDKRVWMISGECYLQDKSVFGDNDYTFSLRTDTWGWATWKRAWMKCDFKLKMWPIYKRDHVLEKSNYMIFYHEIAYMKEQLDNIFKKRDESIWDYQWRFHMLINGGLCIIPRVNLINNIGWGEESTHTKGSRLTVFDVETKPMKFPMKHPSAVIANGFFDKKYGELLSPPKKLKEKILAYIKEKIL